MLREYSEREQEVGKLTVSRFRDFEFLHKFCYFETLQGSLDRSQPYSGSSSSEEDSGGKADL